MSDDADPPRLSKAVGNEAYRRLAALVEQSQSDVATDEQLAQLEATLLPFIGPPSPVGAPPSPGGAAPAPSGGGAVAVPAATAGALKAAAVIGMGALIAGGVWLGVARKPAPPPVVEPAPRVVEPAPSPSPSTVAEAPASEPRIVAEPSASTKAPVAPPAAMPSEADLLGQAQRAVQSNPARALALAEQHARLYPSGVLVQEREVLAVEALERLGRTKAASARAERFLKTFPGSAHRSKIMAIVAPR